MTFFADDWLYGGTLRLANFIVYRDDHVTNDAVTVLVLSLELSDQLLCMLYVMYFGSSLHQSSMLPR
jgi:hypothetical protein